MRLLAIDPGIRGCGVAVFEDGNLVSCAYVKNPFGAGDDPNAVLGMAHAVTKWSLPVETCVFEHPRIYTAAKSKGDNNDLMPLVAIGYLVAARYAVQTRVYPHEWKGQMPKEVCAARIRNRLTAQELDVLDRCLTKAGAKGHNTVDAVGIGLHAVGRFSPKKAWE